jgi:DNA-binding PadR family transcriptional regulator
VASEPSAGRPDRPDLKVYELTQAGQQRVTDWLAEVSWLGPAPAEFHLKLVAAMAEPDGSEAGLLLEGLVLRLQADLRWLEECERHWTSRRD